MIESTSFSFTSAPERCECFGSGAKSGGKYYGTRMNRFQEGRLAMLVKETSGHMHKWSREELEDITQGFVALGKRQAGRQDE